MENVCGVKLSEEKSGYKIFHTHMIENLQK